MAYLCSYYKAAKIFILNRNLEKAGLIADEINSLQEKPLVYPLALEEFDKLPGEKMLCIQATSVGLAPHEDRVVIENKKFYERIHTGYDLIYRPANTRFMQLVKEQGGRAFHGLKMLLYQGIEAYEIWNECKVEESLCNTIYEKMKGEMGIEE